MPTNTTDVVIPADLSLRDGNLRSTGVYRDDRPGAEARRSHLAEVRRRELAMMPLTLSHLFAHRLGRAAAGAAAILCASVLVLVVADPPLLRLTSWLIPGFAVGMFAMIACATVLASYVAASWIAEARFERRMREAIGSSGDLYHDLDQLAEGPYAAAAANVRKLDPWSVGLPLAGLATLVPAIGFISYAAAVAYTLHHALLPRAEIFENIVSANLGSVVFAIAGAVVLAVAIGRACDREQRRGLETSTLVRWLSSLWVLAAAAVLAVVTLGGAIHVVHTIHVGLIPSPNLRGFLAIAGELAVVLPSAWALLWWRRHERARLGD